MMVPSYPLFFLIDSNMNDVLKHLHKILERKEGLFADMSFHHGERFATNRLSVT